MQEEVNKLITFFEDKVATYKADGKRIMASSSFQGHSIPMLMLISMIDNEIPIYFLNTGFHFAESVEYKNKIAQMLNLNVIDVSSPIPKSQQMTPDGQLMFAQQPDHCCHMNKTLPMEPILASHDIWITGVRRDQNENRRNLNHEAKGKYGKKAQHRQFPKEFLNDGSHGSIGTFF